MGHDTNFVDQSTADRAGFSYGRSRLVVQLWRCIDILFFRYSPTLLFGWRNFLLRALGAKLGKGVKIWPRVRITLPWKLTVGDYSGVGEEAWIYNIDDVEIGNHVVVSQKVILCTASHDPASPTFRTETGKITLQNGCWIAMDSFIMPGVTVGQNTVVGARSLVLKDLPPNRIAAGHPARLLSERKLVSEQ